MWKIVSGVNYWLNSDLFRPGPKKIVFRFQIVLFKIKAQHLFFRLSILVGHLKMAILDLKQSFWVYIGQNLTSNSPLIWFFTSDILKVDDWEAYFIKWTTSGEPPVVGSWTHSPVALGFQSLVDGLDIDILNFQSTIYETSGCAILCFALI